MLWSACYENTAIQSWSDILGKCKLCDIVPLFFHLSKLEPGIYVCLKKKGAHAQRKNKTSYVVLQLSLGRSLLASEINEWSEEMWNGSYNVFVSPSGASVTSSQSSMGEQKLTLVFFLGGVTQAEVAALRFLAQQDDGEWSSPKKIWQLGFYILLLLFLVSGCHCSL